MSNFEVPTKQAVFNDVTYLCIQYLSADEIRPEITGFIRDAAMRRYSDVTPTNRAKLIEVYVRALNETLESINKPELVAALAAYTTGAQS